MKNNHIPHRINPENLARFSREISGEIQVSELRRISNIVSNNTGNIYAKFSFQRNRSGHILIYTDVKLSAYLQCQRCLEEMILPIHSQQSYIIGDTLREICMEGYEPIEMSGRLLNLREILIEDELLLAIPISPKHLPTECLTSSNSSYTFA